MVHGGISEQVDLEFIETIDRHKVGQSGDFLFLFSFSLLFLPSSSSSSLSLSFFKDRLNDRHSCLNLYPCVIKFNQSISLSLSLSLPPPLFFCVCVGWGGGACGGGGGWGGASSTEQGLTLRGAGNG